jgi:hypothetical protein
MSIYAVEEKDPDAVLAFDMPWDDRLLPGDSLATSVWTVPAGLVQAFTSTFGTDYATVWLGGGTVGTKYECRNRITTTFGETDDRTLLIEIVEH